LPESHLPEVAEQLIRDGILSDANRNTFVTTAQTKLNAIREAEAKVAEADRLKQEAADKAKKLASDQAVLAQKFGDLEKVILAQEADLRDKFAQLPGLKNAVVHVPGLSDLQSKMKEALVIPQQIAKLKVGEIPKKTESLGTLSDALQKLTPDMKSQVGAMLTMSQEVVTQFDEFLGLAAIYKQFREEHKNLLATSDRDQTRKVAVDMNKKVAEFRALLAQNGLSSSHEPFVHKGKEEVLAAVDGVLCTHKDSSESKSDN
jgi:DNA repair exonuclease SbcCD ATPase subunit